MIDQDKKTVLIAEDDPEFRILLRRFLEHEYTVVLMGNGKDAMEYLDEHVPDIVLTDVIMPKADGIELLEHLRSSERTSNIPAVVLLATASEQDVEKAQELKGTVILPKEEITRYSIIEFLKQQLEEA